MGWFSRKKAVEPADSAPTTEVPADPDPLTAAREAYRETARERIRSGFVVDRADLAAEIVEFRDDLELPDDVAQVEAAAAVDLEWTARLAEQASWTEPGDHARVRAAFDELAADGIVGRMNFTCCQTCGTEEIDDERTELAPGETSVREGYGFKEWGYTFFHQQDAERLADEPADLFLSYSCFLPAPSVDPVLVDRMLDGDDTARQAVIRESDLAAGRQVVAALRRHDLTVEWPEDTRQRIRVVGLRWRMPLPA